MYVVLAKTDPTKGTKGISAFIVEGKWDGVKPGVGMHKLGMNSSDTTEVVFENVVVPAENLLGEEGTSEETNTTTPPPSTDTVSSVDAAFNELMGA